MKASEITGIAAMYQGYEVKKSEVHGMSQRGGSVESHLRLGRNIYSPLIPEGEVDFLVGLDKTEAERVEHFLKSGGRDLTKYLDFFLSEVENYRTLNVCFLGLLSNYLPIQEENWLRALRKSFQPPFIYLNREAFYLGKQGGGKK